MIKVSVEALIHLLKEVPNSDEPLGHYPIHENDITKIFKTLDARNLSEEILAPLEFAYIDILQHTERGIPNLEKQISISPNLFLLILALAYKRNDNQEDPPEWFIHNGNAKEKLELAAYSLLRTIKLFADFTQDNNEIDIFKLREWVNEVRLLCSQHAREDIGDYVLGVLLAKFPSEKDGVWPCMPVRQIIEEIASKNISDGIISGICDSNGCMPENMRIDQENGYARQYRKWSTQLAYEYPYVSSLLEQIAFFYEKNAKFWSTQKAARERLY